MPYYAKDEIARAREVDLLTYLQRCEPNELVHVGGNVYSTRTHDSLKISNGMWCWWSRGIGGKTALDYLIKVCNMTLPDAIKAIAGAPRSSAPAYAQMPQPPPAFELPPKHADERRGFAQPSGRLYRRLSFSSRKINLTSFLAVKASARLCWKLCGLPTFSDTAASKRPASIPPAAGKKKGGSWDSSA